jgi:HD-GYP domain-containing protein (c-di-GMP phosphodiesterase class II)
VTELTRGILEELQVGGPEAALIVLAARIHDIGKIGVPDEVLKKAGPLTPAEWEIMREHPVLGADLLSRYPGFERGVEIVRHHHERWDGGGYPDRLKGTAIPFGARVVAVADAYDAMTGHRPYRPGMAPHVAREILAGGRGVQWDSPIVDAFLRRVPEAVWEPTPPRHTQADIGSEIALEA